MTWTTDKLAEKSGYTKRHITRLLNAGKIVGEKIGRDWLVDDEEAEKWLKENGFISSQEDGVSPN